MARVCVWGGVGFPDFRGSDASRAPMRTLPVTDIYCGNSMFLESFVVDTEEIFHKR